MSEQAVGEFLVTQGALSTDGLRRALDAQRALECRLGTVLLDLGLLSETTLLSALGRFHSSRTVSAATLATIPESVVEMVPPRFALRHEVVPFRLDGKTLSVATIEPKNLLVEDELGLMTDCMIASYVALEVRLDEALAKHYLKQLPVQMASVLKRLPVATKAADGATEVGEVVLDTGDGTDVLTDVVGGRAAQEETERVGYRAGLARQREQDPTMMVVMSEDDLADLPSLRGSVEDTEAATVDGPKGAEVQAVPVPDTVSVSVESPAVDPSPRPEQDKDAETNPVDEIESRLDAAAVAMLDAEMREDIADAILEFCAPYLRRRVLLALRDGVVMGWRGEGDGIDPLWVKSMSIPASEPSVFVSLNLKNGIWRGSLPSTPANQELLLGLGGEQPSECVVLPLMAHSKPIGFVYGDNLDQGLGEVPLEALRRLATKAGIAFQVYILKSKVRTA
jgi:hypothetical protein